MTIAEFRKLGTDGKPKAKAKYRNKKIVIDGIEFDSTKEGNRYQDLKLWQQTGQITELTHQRVFEIHVNGIFVCEYHADFTYKKEGALVVEDTKSKPTRELPEYRLKKKLMKAALGIEIEEV